MKTGSRRLQQRFAADFHQPPRAWIPEALAATTHGPGFDFGLSPNPHQVSVLPAAQLDLMGAVPAGAVCRDLQVVDPEQPLLSADVPVRGLHRFRESSAAPEVFEIDAALGVGVRYAEHVEGV